MTKKKSACTAGREAKSVHDSMLNSCIHRRADTGQGHAHDDCSRTTASAHAPDNTISSRQTQQIMCPPQVHTKTENF